MFEVGSKILIFNTLVANTLIITASIVLLLNFGSPHTQGQAFDFLSFFMSDLSDQTLKCRDCGADFVWTASEQEFYQQKGFTNPPSRCVECRKAKKAQFNAGRGGGGGGYSSGPRQMFDAVCASCGKPTQVPFQPSGSKPVYCLDCFKQQRGR